MSDQIKAILAKVAKLEERKAKMAAIFEKSRTKRTATLAKLEAVIAKVKETELRIAEKEAVTMTGLDTLIIAAQKEETDLKAAIVEAVSKTEEPVSKTEEPA